MMTMIRAAAVLTLVTTAAVHAQAALTGTWQGESPNGSQVVLSVTANGAALTGTLTVDGQSLTIADGKVAKNTLSFTVMLPPNGAIQAFNGEFADDQVKIWMDQRGPGSAAVLKRAKK